MELAKVKKHLWMYWSPLTLELKTEQASEEAKPMEEKKENDMASNVPLGAEEPREVPENAKASETVEIGEIQNLQGV